MVALALAAVAVAVAVTAAVAVTTLATLAALSALWRWRRWRHDGTREGVRVGGGAWVPGAVGRWGGEEYLILLRIADVPL